jgi:thiamine transport system permease protein
MPLGQRYSWSLFFLGLIPLGALAFWLVYPLWQLFRLTLSQTGVLTLFESDYYRTRWLWTLGQALATVVLVLILGLPSAWFFARYRFWGKRWLEALLLLPFTTPVVVAAVGFLALFGANSPINLRLHNSIWLILLANLFYNYAVAVRIIMASIAGLANRPLEAASSLGSSPWRVFWRIAWPQLAPTVLSVAVLVFLYSFTAFGVGFLLGGTRWATIEVEIYSLIGQGNTGLAGWLALWQLVFTAISAVVYLNVQPKSAASGLFATTLPLARGWNLVLLTACALFACLLTFAPLLAVFWQAFGGPSGPNLRAFSALWLRGGSVFDVPLWTALANSLGFALVTLLLVTPLGLILALAARFLPRISFWWQSVGLLPLFISPVALGLAFIVTFPANIWLLLAAYLLQALPFLLRSITPALDRLPDRLLEAATMLGSSPWRLLWRLVLPNLAAGLRAGLALAYATVVGEFAATLVLARPEWTTLVGLVQNRLSRPGQLSEACALAVVLLLVTFGGVFIIGGAFGRGNRDML